MREILIYWWSAYGNFAPGVDNLPSVGDVIRYYRKLRGMSHEELATILGWTIRYIKMLVHRHQR
jgi:DNA-directed RNA polymerase specialized sigma24 family protein